MMEKKIVIERIKFFLFGILAVTGLLFLAGFNDNSAPTLNNGRYQLSSWAGSFGDDSGGVGAFVVDTVSGETKTVYMRLYGKPGKSDVIKNDLRTSFSSIK
jgi:major membrane immunogen (membrane-anchored lipoprotein)